MSAPYAALLGIRGHVYFPERPKSPYALPSRLRRLEERVWLTTPDWRSAKNAESASPKAIEQKQSASKAATEMKQNQDEASGVCKVRILFSFTQKQASNPPAARTAHRPMHH